MFKIWMRNCYLYLDMCIRHFNLLVHQFYVVFCSENFNITKPAELI